MTGDQIITGTGGPLPGPEIIAPTPSEQRYGQTVTMPTSTQIAARDALAYNPLSNPEVGGIENLGAPFEYSTVGAS
jgi:hypothetical protein